jgi:hypothetical protein
MDTFPVLEIQTTLRAKASYVFTGLVREYCGVNGNQRSQGGSHLSIVTMIGFDEFGWDA